MLLRNRNEGADRFRHPWLPYNASFRAARFVALEHGQRSLWQVLAYASGAGAEVVAGACALASGGFHLEFQPLGHGDRAALPAIEVSRPEALPVTSL
jgi:hypothetical protein